MKFNFVDFSHKKSRKMGERLAILVAVIAIIHSFVAKTPNTASVPSEAPVATPVVTETAAPAVTPAPTEKPVDAPVANAKALATVNIGENAILTVEDGVYYDLGDHVYASIGLDGTALPFDVYYGVELRVDAANSKQLWLTWHNYTDQTVHPTTVTVGSPYYDISCPLMDFTQSEGKDYPIHVNGAKSGPYTVYVSWSNDTVTPVNIYVNGNKVYTCKAADRSGAYICRWYDRKNAIDALIATAGVTPENSLDYSDDRWAHPVPADYDNSKYRCDNQRWIDLAYQLVPDQSVSDAQKAVVIHDWMTANLAYDNYKVTTLGNATRAKYNKDYTGRYSMWDLRVGVCADFATIYCIMLRSLGVPAVGLAQDNVHVWNLVYLDGEWVEIDITGDMRRQVMGEDTTDILCANATVSYRSFGAPYDTATIDPARNHINRGMYTRAFVTGNGWY